MMRNRRLRFTFVMLLAASIWVPVNTSFAKGRQERDQVEALMLEASAGDVTAVDQRLRSGLNVDARYSHNETALMVGALHATMVKFLLDSGADANARSSLGLTPLMYASLGNEVTPVRELLAAGAVIDATDNDGRTALMWAALGGKLDIAQYLIERGADIKMVDRAGKTARDIALEQGHAEIVRALDGDLVQQTAAPN